MMISFIFAQIPVSKVAVFASHRNGCFLFFFIFISISMHWTRKHDILLSREVLALEVYKHKKNKMNLIDVLLEDIAERERDAIAEASKKKGQEKATAEDIRNQALERMGKQRNENLKTAKSQRRGNLGEAVMRLSSMQEKAESDKAFREEDLKIRKQEEETKAAQFQAMFTQQQSFLQAMTQQQAQQQQQNQHMQMLMAQQSQAMMSVLEKLLSKE